MTKQDKKVADDSSGSGASGTGFVYSGSRSRSGPSDTTDSSQSLPWAVKKVICQASNTRPSEILTRFVVTGFLSLNRIFI
ncbi:hypothetical protein HanXRQr2_Chr13g0570471 [Helianthus annuus]|uniref:Uncharacterized protein n=1 Tax=Helianthus annuus TaxID=4232 RepID=A0A251SPC2_HELAN|nr:hypothetical protein HanXRQr2_Chr13g0570471 [Helianthus annuus]